MSRLPVSCDVRKTLAVSPIWFPPWPLQVAPTLDTASRIPQPWNGARDGGCSAEERRRWRIARGTRKRGQPERERERVARGASPATVAHTSVPCLRSTVCLHTDARAHTHLRAALGQGLFQGTRRLACAGDVGLECRYLICTRARQRTCGPSGPADDSQAREEALQAAAPSQGRSSLWELVTYDTRGHGALQCCAGTCTPAVASSHLAPP